jgi:hypothetical protein
LENLLNKWENQGGKCPFTHRNLILRKTYRESLGNSTDRASLDRIDSEQGYTPENIRWVSVIAQYAKNTFSDDELIKFCKDVAEKN